MTDEVFPVARCLFIGKVLLGYPEREVWRMTLRKLSLLYAEYLEHHGVKTACNLDDVLPV